MPARQPPVRGDRVASAAADAAGSDGRVAFVVSCEHGGNRVPARYRELFATAQAALASHRGYDPGALTVARELARRLGAPLVAATTTRLLVDLNRSPGHPKLHSEWVPASPPGVRADIRARHYLPYRRQVEELVAGSIGRGQRVVHVSSHSFTPVLDGVVRNADVGILYDPGRPGEVALSARWIAALQARAPHVKVRRNYPYPGKSDGLCAWMRRHHAAADYVGIELEVNQRHVAPGRAEWRALRAAIIASLAEALELEKRAQPAVGT
ncbi:N-formylglutamate amidohydrolase [Aromatoleum buckelii]|uniref:N-formylglutamate amidohydrolase n=1 Tax=Aromatoleum buckelii TaxID=200254 RepID=A0ABX1N1R8_9RHOO|nr:N-formylglutamate amidohydrolase [Aromatoleum buckelii]MCK0512604.1 N-formylglutamate amidohydrolase [Aromatoleum buckelii]